MSLPIAAWSGKIESISQEGLGIGTLHVSHDGKHVRRPIFIPFTVPGDVVETKVVEQKRKYFFGEISSILAPSAQRVVPRCPQFGTCGGCNLQHVSYEEQLRQKAQQIQFLVGRKGVKLPHDVVVLPARQRSGYRWRAKVAVRFSGGQVTAGFRMFHSHDVVPVKACTIVAPQVQDLITKLNKMEARIQGSFTQDVIVVVGDAKKLGILVPLDETPPEARKRVREFFEDLYARDRKLIGNLFFEENRVTKTSGQVQEHITYKAAGLTFSFLPETFIQSNVATNELLIEKAMELLAPGKDDVVLDVYAGIGNLSLPAAKTAKAVVAVEGHEASVLLGRINMYQNRIENVTVIHRSAEKYLQEHVKRSRAREYSEEYPAATKLLIDPPRTGCTPQVLHAILASDLKTVLYISCNPVTLASDLVQLAAKYDVKGIVGIDMFPDISHVETVVLLERKADRKA